MAQIYYRGEYQWLARIRRVGYPQQTKTFLTKADAEAWVREIEGKMDRGVFIDRSILEKTKFRALIDRYEEEITPTKRGSLKEKSKLKMLRKTLLSEMSLARIQPGDIVDFRKERSSIVAPATVTKEMNLLSNIFHVARTEWKMPGLENPVTGVRRPKAPKGRNRRLHSGDEMERILSATQSPTLRSVMPLAIETAMRRSEMINLLWSDIDFKEQTAHLKETKNGTSRTVPLSRKALELLKEIRGGANEKVYPVTPDAVTQAFGRALRRARKLYEEECIKEGIEPDAKFLTNLRLHDMRREATSRLLEDKNLEVMEVMAITGHKDIRMLDIYTKLRAKRIAKKLD
jgi:integrase